MIGDISLAGVVAAAVEEGCVGETLAAIEAGAAHEAAVDPEVRAALAVITQDEANHAELAWRFVRWAIALDPAMREVAGEVLQAALVAQVPVPEEEADADGLAALGRLTAHRRALLRKEGLAEVVRPAALALLR